MSLEELVAALDVLIARRSAAREILVSLLSKEEIRLPRLARPTLEAVTVAAKEQPAAEPHTAPVPVTMLRPKLARERRSSPRARVTVQTALSGAIPAGPVAVSPRDISRRQEKQTGAATELTAPPRSSFDDLVAEVTRRTTGQGSPGNPANF